MQLKNQNSRTTQTQSSNSKDFPRAVPNPTRTTQSQLNQSAHISMALFGVDILRFFLRRGSTNNPMEELKQLEFFYVCTNHDRFQSLRHPLDLNSTK